MFDGFELNIGLIGFIDDKLSRFVLPTHSLNLLSQNASAEQTQQVG